MFILKNIRFFDEKFRPYIIFVLEMNKFLGIGMNKNEYVLFLKCLVGIIDEGVGAEGGEGRSRPEK